MSVHIISKYTRLPKPSPVRDFPVFMFLRLNSRGREFDWSRCSIIE